MNAGIDYGMGKTNIDTETGIRYGVISQHTVSQAWADSAEADYGKPTCPKCGNEAVEYSGDGADIYEHSNGCSDYQCDACCYVFDSGEAYGDEPNGWYYDAEGYVLTDCLDSDIMVIKSPYYTYAQFCSPCVPGAGNLNTPMEQGAKSYCLGHEWFEAEEETTPYPVYRVGTDELVPPLVREV